MDRNSCRLSKHTQVVIAILLLVRLAGPACGQSSLEHASTPARLLPIVWRATTPLAPMPESRVDAVTLSRYLSYGSVIGIAGGLAWGAITEHRQTRALDIVGDAAIGWVVGLAGGAAAYIVHEASHPSR